MRRPGPPYAAAASSSRPIPPVSGRDRCGRTARYAPGVGRRVGQHRERTGPVVTDMVAKRRGQAHLGAHRSWVADGAQGVERGLAQLKGRAPPRAWASAALECQQMPSEGSSGSPGRTVPAARASRRFGQIAAFPQDVGDPEPTPQFCRCAAQTRPTSTIRAAMVSRSARFSRAAACQLAGTEGGDDCGAVGRPVGER